MDTSRLSLFIAGVLILTSAGTSVLFYSKYKGVEADRAKDADRIRELQSQIALAEETITDYRDKLRHANAIAKDFERERDAKVQLALTYASKIDELETKMKAMQEPARPKEPVVATLVEGDVPRADDGGLGTTTSTETADTGEEPTTTTPTGRSDLEKELEEVRTEKRDLEMKYAALVGDKAEGVPLGQVKVTTGLRIKGKVLVVNRRHNFVVVDVGARDGIEKGMVIILHRGRKYIGKCQVERVYDRMAAADLLQDWMQDDVQVNDGARKF